MGGFHAIDIRGRFYEAQDTLCVEQEGQEHVELLPLLNPLLGVKVKFYVAYEPLQAGSAAPGGGSCLWGQAEFCPVHRLHPDRVVQFFEEGILEERAGSWYVGVKKVPLDLMNGHYGRVIGVTVVDKEALMAKLAQGDVESLLGDVGEQMEMMQSLLGHLRKER